MSFNKHNLINIRADIDAALKAVEQKHGMKLSLGNIRFSSDTFSGKLIGAVGTAAATSDEGSNSELKWRTAFVRNYFISLTKEDLDKEITLRAEKYILVGARPKAQSQMVLKNVKSGKYIAATANEVRLALGRPINKFEDCVREERAHYD